MGLVVGPVAFGIQMDRERVDLASNVISQFDGTIVQDACQCVERNPVFMHVDEMLDLLPVVMSKACAQALDDLRKLPFVLLPQGFQVCSARGSGRIGCRQPASQAMPKSTGPTASVIGARRMWSDNAGNGPAEDGGVGCSLGEAYE